MTFGQEEYLTSISRSNILDAKPIDNLLKELRSYLTISNIPDQLPKKAPLQAKITEELSRLPLFVARGLKSWDGLVVGLALHDLQDPFHVIGVSDNRILQPEAPWEGSGYVHNVVFTCGTIPEEDGTLKIYWGGADTVMCVGTANIKELIELCINSSRSSL